MTVDARLGVAGLLVIASTFVLVSGITFACYVATAGYDNVVLGEALTDLAELAGTAGLLALVAILVEWFAIQDSSVAGAGHRPMPTVIKYFRGPLSLATALGILVIASGLAGIAGAALSASSRLGPTPGIGWYTFEQLSIGVATAILGLAVTLGSIWSLRTHLSRKQVEPASLIPPSA